MHAPATIDNLAERIASGFLKHASEIPGENWRERWLWVNRGAGIIIGAAVTLSAFGPFEGQSAEGLAQQIAAAVVAKIPAGKTERTLAKGLEVRILKCFLALGGESKAADSLTPKQLQALRDKLARQRGRAS